MEEIQKQISKLQKRLDNLYMDKLDGRIKIISIKFVRGSNLYSKNSRCLRILN